MTETSAADTACPCRVCFPEPPADELERGCLETVQKLGWQVMLVNGGGSGEPAFAYTVGLPHQVRHPELVMSGLPLDLMHRVLNNVAQRVVAGRRLVTPGEVVEGELTGAALVVHDMTQKGLSETVTWSGWFHRLQPAARLLVWPDTSGVFPWQAGAPSILDERQPPAWRVPVALSGVLASVVDWPMPVPGQALAFVCAHVIDEGAGVRFAARDVDPRRGEEWSFHCGGDHPGDDSSHIRLVHMEHVVRAAPSLAALADMPVGEHAWMDDLDTPWRPYRATS